AALTTHADLREADLVLLNEADVGMARSGNRDVVADLGRALGFHTAWAPLFLETTSGRDDDPASAGGRENEEALFGLGMLSRFPVGAARVIELPSPQALTFDGQRMYGRYIALAAAFERPGEVRSLPKPLRAAARRVLDWAERRGRLRLDWFAARGFQGGSGFTVPGLDGPGRASDHAPLAAQFV